MRYFTFGPADESEVWSIQRSDDGLVEVLNIKDLTWHRLREQDNQGREITEAEARRIAIAMGAPHAV